VIISLFWVSELRKLPKTQLIVHNIYALSHFRFPMRMPSPWLLNQVLNMLDRRWEMSNWYVYLNERWEPHQLFSNWCSDLRRMLSKRVLFAYIAKELTRIPAHVGPLFLQCFDRESVEFWGFSDSYCSYSHFLAKFDGVYETRTNKNYISEMELYEVMTGKRLLTYCDDIGSYQESKCIVEEVDSDLPDLEYFSPVDELD